MSLSALIDFIGQQKSLSGAQDWAEKNLRDTQPELADLAQADPRSFQSMLPSIIKQQQESKAFQQLYAPPQQQAAQPTPYDRPREGVPLDADSALAQLNQLPPEANTNGISWNSPRVTPSPDNSDQLKKYGAIAALPSNLQQQAILNLSTSGGGTGVGGGLTGDELLKNLPSSDANMVTAMHEGRVPFTGMSARSPQMQRIVALTEQAFPDFDATAWQERSKVAKDFSAGGGSGQKITQVQTAINHLASLADASEKLGGANVGFISPLLNAPYNMVNSQNTNLINYKRFQTLAGDEIANFVAGGKGSTIGDRKTQADQLDINNSPQARTAAAQAGVQAMFGKLEPIVEQYNKSFGANKNVTDFLSPETQGSLAKLGMMAGEDNQLTKSSDQPAKSLGEAPKGLQDGVIVKNRKTGQTATVKDGKLVPLQ